MILLAEDSIPFKRREKLNNKAASRYLEITLCKGRIRKGSRLHILLKVYKGKRVGETAMQ
jgi:hypothetical protein